MAPAVEPITKGFRAAAKEMFERPCPMCAFSRACYGVVDSFGSKIRCSGPWVKWLSGRSRAWIHQANTTEPGPRCLLMPSLCVLTHLYSFLDPYLTRFLHGKLSSWGVGITWALLWPSSCSLAGLIRVLWRKVLISSKHSVQLLCISPASCLVKPQGLARNNTHLSLSFPRLLCRSAMWTIMSFLLRMFHSFACGFILPHLLPCTAALAPFADYVFWWTCHLQYGVSFLGQILRCIADNDGGYCLHQMHCPCIAFGSCV